MTDFFNPNEHDADVSAALATLPEPPPHRNDFWAALDKELAATSPEQPPANPRFGGRAPFLLAVAALFAVVVGGTAVFSSRTADDVALEPAAAPSTTTREAPEASTTETFDQPTTTTAEGEAVAQDPTTTLVPLERAASEMFLYDVAVPQGFSVGYADGQGVLLNFDEAPGEALLQTTNFFAGDEAWLNPLAGEDAWRSFTSPYPGESLVEQSSIDVPVYAQVEDTVGLLDIELCVEQYIFEVPGERTRWVRVFSFGDRTVVAEVAENDGAALTVSPVEMLDGIRLFEGALELSDTCSTGGLPALGAPAELNDAQRARFDQIVLALTTCDWDLLGAQLGTGFMPTIGGGEAIPMWQESERFGDPTLTVLYDHLALSVGVDAETGEASWPRGWATPEGPDAETIEDLVTAGYASDQTLEIWNEIGYIGYRTAIAADGTWVYFLAGD